MARWPSASKALTVRGGRPSSSAPVSVGESGCGLLALLVSISPRLVLSGVKQIGLAVVAVARKRGMIKRLVAGKRLAVQHAIMQVTVALRGVHYQRSGVRHAPASRSVHRSGSRTLCLSPFAVT